jgi:hypothetical protein
VAFTHHQAAFGDQRRGGKTDLIGTQQGGYHHVTAGGISGGFRMAEKSSPLAYQ